MHLLVATGFDWVSLLGPFHVVMLHYPIGFLTLAGLLEAWTVRNPGAAPRRAVGFTLGVNVLAVWLVVGLGLLRADRGEFEPEVLSLHRLFGILVAVLSTVCWWLHRSLCPEPERTGILRAYRILLGVSLALLVVAGHQGGTLTHGSRFLFVGLPPALAGLFGAAPSPVAPPGTVPDVFQKTIWPIFERKCVQCHGPEKQKSRYRLDDREAALRGGASGKPAIVPGEPMTSRLVQALLLPADHDEAMPPEGKDRLTDSEVMAVIRWIQGGAPFGPDQR